MHVPGYPEYFNRWKLLSGSTGKKLTVIKSVPYGHLPRENLDLYPSARPQSKTLVFIHGGYWHMFDKSLFHFIANSFHAYGVTTVLLGYPLSPDANMDQIVLSCRSAIRWLYKNVSAYRGDPHQMYVAGHSAGGHLAAMVMATEWKVFDPNLSAGPLQGMCAVSGLFNLVPIHLSYINQVLQMDQETALRNSPIWLEPFHTCPVLLAVGEAETNEYKDQSQELLTRWNTMGIDLRFLQLPGENHFSMAEKIADPLSALHQALRQLMQI